MVEEIRILRSFESRFQVEAMVYKAITPLFSVAACALDDVQNAKDLADDEINQSRGHCPSHEKLFES